MKIAALALIFLTGHAQANSFGTPGSVGKQGYPGRAGRDGRPLTLVADGGGASHTVTGGDGDDGERGEDGGDARYCQQPVDVPYDLKGADGGRGGQGGDGGRGGDGGDITVHYADLQHLRNLFIRGTPGRGGRGSYGGRGGRPCACSIPSWTVMSTDFAHTYYCRIGEYGPEGYNGRNGPRGGYGEVRLIGQLEPLIPTKTSDSLRMEQMETTPVTLASHVWERRSGARHLFAPGSDTADSYLFFVESIRRTVTFEWKATMPLSQVAGKYLGVRLDGRDVRLSLPSNLWVVADELVGSESNRRFVFTQALSSPDAFRLTLGTPTGNGSALKVEIRDAANLTETVGTRLEVDYYTQGGLFYHRRYKGAVPETAIVKSPSGLTVALGALPIPAEYLKPGVKVSLQIDVVRSLGGYSGTKTLSVKHRIQ